MDYWGYLGSKKTVRSSCSLERFFQKGPTRGCFIKIINRQLGRNVFFGLGCLFFKVIHITGFQGVAQGFLMAALEHRTFGWSMMLSFLGLQGLLERQRLLQVRQFNSRLALPIGQSPSDF